MIVSLRSILISSIVVCASWFSYPVKADAAEKINFVYPPLKFSLSVESLEIFAETGEITRDFQDYARFFDQATLAQLRRFLSKSYNFEQLTLSKISRTSLGEDILKQLGKVVSTHPQRNGFYSIRGAILTTAGENDSWTVIDILKAFPTEQIEVNLQSLAQLKDDLFLYQNYREAVLQAIKLEAENEAKNNNSQVNFANLPDLREQGQYNFKKQTITLERKQYRQTQDGFVSEYNFELDLYFPENLRQPAPLILISHGFGSVRQNYISLAEHLATYGYVVAVPEHIGSDLRYRQELLKTGLSSALSPVEYLDRPRDISFVIDKLQEFSNTDSGWVNIINFEQIGIIGDSLGGTTVLSLAGAPLNISRLRDECQASNIIINTALILQCQANNLPPVEYDLKDDRIKAVISAHPLTSAIFGPESMAQIDIPILITAGSDDIVTPVVTEQLHPFMWLENEEKHLLVYQPGTHFSSSKPSTEYTADYLPEVLIGRNRAISSRYFQGVAVAFMEVYVKGNNNYLPYLNAGYGEFISQENSDLEVSQIQQLNKETIVSAYGQNLPVNIVPDTIATKNNPMPNQTSIIKEIKETGTLKIAYPRNTEPFGYLDSQGQWSGFCDFFADKLADYLTQKLELETKPKVVTFPSNLNNRFNLVANNKVHLECGANTIVENHPEVNFSVPFFVTGTYFLIPKTSLNNFNPNQSLAQSKIGVYTNTSTASFLEEKYPQTKPIYLTESQTVDNAIIALENQQVDAIIDDGIILQTKLTNNQQLAEKYQIVPQLPLQCDFYGLLLPKNDRQWTDLVNQFMNNNDLTSQYFPEETNRKLAEGVNYCLNFNN